MRSWLSFSARGRKRAAQRPARLGVERLECRVVPAGVNILVTNGQNLQVYSPSGDLISSEIIPIPAGGDGPARDLIVDQTDQEGTHVYNGTQAVPFLSSTIDDGQNWIDTAGPAGWSTDTASENGGIAAFGDFIFTTDMDVSGDGRGIIRWNLTDGSSERVVDLADYVDLTIGLNGKLYALTPPSGDEQEIHVFDPLALDQFETVSLPAEPNFTGIAVDRRGRIYAVSWNTPDVWRFSPTGQQQLHRRLEGGQLNNLLDIDISDDGKLLMGNDKGYVVRLAVANFTGNGGGTLPKRLYKVIQVMDANGTDPAEGPTFVSWADPQEIEIPHVTVTGRKFHDLNTNGVRDLGEPGLTGWTIFADFNENGLLDAGEPSAETNELGQYTLDVNIAAQSTFRLMEEGQLGWAQVFEAGATADEPTAEHPYYTLTFTDGDQSGKSFGNHPTNFVVSPTDGLKTTETGKTATFTVVLTARPTADVIIPVQSLDLTEGTVSTLSLTFTSANWNVPQTVTVMGLADGVFDGNVAYSIGVGPTTSADANYNGLLEQQVQVTNFDSAPVDKVGIVRDLPRRWRLDAVNDGVYTPGLDRQYVRLGAGKTIVGDWNGDGFDDLGLFRSDTGTFQLFVDGVLTRTVTMLDGKVGGKPLVGNWDGVVGDEVGIYRGSTGVFTLDVDNDGATSDADDLSGALDGLTGGQALVGDWNGDNTEEVGVYRPETGTFRLDLDGDLASQDLDDIVMTQLAGRVGGKALVGDWDGNGTDNVGLYYNLSGKWFLDTNSDATTAEKTITRLDGNVGGKPIVGDFDADGVTDCGLFRAGSGRWIIDLDNNGVFNVGVDLEYTNVDGATGGLPLVGRWALPT
jgi:hypothetical protein